MHEIIASLSHFRSHMPLFPYATDEIPDETTPPPQPPKKKRGRPPGSKNKPKAATDGAGTSAAADAPPPPKKKRGRPPKVRFYLYYFSNISLVESINHDSSIVSRCT